jgi:hypothetical protein
MGRMKIVFFDQQPIKSLAFGFVNQSDCHPVEQFLLGGRQ